MVISPTFFILFTWISLLCMHVKRELRNPQKSYKTWQNYSKKSLPPSNKIILNKVNADIEVFDADSNGIFWFCQISDIHLSKFRQGRGHENLEVFLDSVLPIVNPHFIIVTGDITDGKGDRYVRSQNIEEWIMYNELLIKYGIHEKKNFWLDIRGNHDCYNVSGCASPNDYYQKFSIKKTSSFSHIFEFSFGKYGVISIDGCPKYGTCGLFNFFGYLSKEKMDLLENQLNEHDIAGVIHNIIICHYPVFTMQFEKSSSGKTIAELSEKFTAYLSGHLHRLVFDLGKDMFAIQPTGFADWEVDDLKENDAFRVVAIDHNIVSFIDASIYDECVILVTNPKDSRISIPKHEPVNYILNSTHIRALIFTDKKIISVIATIDGKSYALSKNFKKSDLWTAQWNPKQLNQSICTFKIEVRFENGSIKRQQHLFSISTLGVQPSGFAHNLLLSSIQENFQIAFWSIFTTCLITIVALRAISVFSKKKKIFKVPKRSKIKNSFGDLYLAFNLSTHLENIANQKCNIFGNLTDFFADDFFYRAFLGWICYISVGPFFISKISPCDKFYSYFFIWGIWRYDYGWVRIFDTWIFGCTMLTVQVLPSCIFIPNMWQIIKNYQKTNQTNFDIPEREKNNKRFQKLNDIPKNAILGKNLYFLFFYGQWLLINCFIQFKVFSYNGAGSIMFGFGFAWLMMISLGLFILYLLSSFKIKM